MTSVGRGNDGRGEVWWCIRFGDIYGRTFGFTFVAKEVSSANFSPSNSTPTSLSVHTSSLFNARLMAQSLPVTWEIAWSVVVFPVASRLKPSAAMEMNLNAVGTATMQPDRDRLRLAISTRRRPRPALRIWEVFTVGGFSDRGLQGGRFY